LEFLPPWLANFVYLIWNEEMQGVDLTPIAFSITGFLLYLGVTRFRLFDLTPVARIFFLSESQMESLFWITLIVLWISIRLALNKLENHSRR
jgi:hypothetical protein